MDKTPQLLEPWHHPLKMKKKKEKVKVPETWTKQEYQETQPKKRD